MDVDGGRPGNGGFPHPMFTGCTGPEGFWIATYIVQWRGYLRTDKLPQETGATHSPIASFSATPSSSYFWPSICFLLLLFSLRSSSPVETASLISLLLLSSSCLFLLAGLLLCFSQTPCRAFVSLCFYLHNLARASYSAKSAR